MKMTRFSTTPLALAAFLCTTAFAYNVSGTVKDELGTPIQGANVTLVQKAKSTLTDIEGKFVLSDATIDAIHAQKPGLGYININDGVLDFSQSGNTPVKIRIFDMMGNLVLNHSLNGSGRLDLRQGVTAHGTYIARVRMGNAEQAVRFTASGSYSSALTAQKSGALYLIQQGKAGNLQVVANGFDTLKIYLPSLDTVLALTLKKSTAGSSPSSSPSSSGASSPSSSAVSSSSSSAASLNPGEQTYDFGYALKNAPRPSTGCGKNSTLQKTRSVENGDRFEMKVGSENREYFITLPKNYDNTKPHKVLFAMHCMGSNAEDFVHHNPDQDHPSPYYGQQKLDTKGEFIFVAPRGDTDGMPWSMNSDKDHKFIDQLITTINENYCVDTTRIFMTGFSFGAMVTNSMAQDMQHRLRAVAVYATADYNIYLPKNKGKPIAWMAVHGKQDGTCPYDKALTSALPRILKNNGPNGTDVSSEKPQEVGGSGHLCYDFKNVDPRFPVKWCSWNGPHQWTAFDNGNWQSTWVPEEVNKFFGQF